MPLYEKSHSWGEFVFDWSWARAYDQAGFDYYPKLVSALPFTPATGRRLLLRDETDADAAALLLDAALALTDDADCSSLHILFPAREELPALRKAGLRVRKDCQFHWHNRDFRSFDDFLATFTSVKRKKAKRDRRRVADNGIRFRRLHGSESYCMPSRFINEIPSDLVEEIRPRIQISRPYVSHAGRQPLEPQAQGLGLGQRVQHAKFGDGVVLNYEGQGAHARVQVNFESAGTKWLVVAYANLQPA